MSHTTEELCAKLRRLMDDEDDEEFEEKDYDEYCEYCQGHYSSKSKYACKNDDGLNFCCLDCVDKSN